MRNELILIIEDDRETRALLKIYLDREGYRTVEASDGEIGLAHHWTLKPDLVILDVSLPRRDGFDVLAEIRRRGHTPVIMVTGRGSLLTNCRAIDAEQMITLPNRSNRTWW
ncbi:response regulator (plasmid) [Rhizobium beringeri]|nr:response regulator [Rhizobium beringeri]